VQIYFEDTQSNLTPQVSSCLMHYLHEATGYSC